MPVVQANAFIQGVRKTSGNCILGTRFEGRPLMRTAFWYSPNGYRRSVPGDGFGLLGLAVDGHGGVVARGADVAQ